MQPTLKTDRLILRPLSLRDGPQFSKLAGDLDIARMTGSIAHPFPLLSAEYKIMILLAQGRQKMAYPYAITQDGGALIGVADLFKRGADTAFEVGYWIGKPFWGQGYITEAITALLDEARRTLNLSECVAGVFFDNPGSMRVLEKLGFHKTGEFGDYFSNARLSKARSFDFHLDLGSKRMSKKA